MKNKKESGYIIHMKNKKESGYIIRMKNSVWYYISIVIVYRCYRFTHIKTWL